MHYSPVQADQKKTNLATLTGKVSEASCESILFFQNMMHDGIRLASKVWRALSFLSVARLLPVACKGSQAARTTRVCVWTGPRSSRPLEHLGQIQEVGHVADEWLSAQTASVGVETGPKY